MDFFTYQTLEFSFFGKCIFNGVGFVNFINSILKSFFLDKLVINFVNYSGIHVFSYGLGL